MAFCSVVSRPAPELAVLSRAGIFSQKSARIFGPSRVLTKPATAVAVRLPENGVRCGRM